MVSLQRRNFLTPDGVQPVFPLRWLPPRAQVRNGCDTVAPQWSDLTMPWRPNPACKICFTEEELHGPPLEDIDPGFCCRCKKWKAEECPTCKEGKGNCGKCCKKRKGCACRQSADDLCQCGPIEINVECERAVRAAKAGICAAARRRWQPAASTRAMRIPSTDNAPPLPVAVRQNTLLRPITCPLRPATKSTFSTNPNRFCCSLAHIGPPIFGNGLSYFGTVGFDD